MDSIELVDRFHRAQIHGVEDLIEHAVAAVRDLETNLGSERAGEAIAVAAEHSLRMRLDHLADGCVDPDEYAEVAVDLREYAEEFKQFGPIGQLVFVAKNEGELAHSPELQVAAAAETAVEMAPRLELSPRQ